MFSRGLGMISKQTLGVQATTASAASYNRLRRPTNSIWSHSHHAVGIPCQRTGDKPLHAGENRAGRPISGLRTSKFRLNTKGMGPNVHGGEGPGRVRSPETDQRWRNANERTRPGWDLGSNGSIQKQLFCTPPPRCSTSTAPISAAKRNQRPVRNVFERPWHDLQADLGRSSKHCDSRELQPSE